MYYLYFVVLLIFRIFRYDYSNYDYSYDTNSASAYPGYETYTAPAGYEGYATSAAYPTGELIKNISFINLIFNRIVLSFY
jgi:hypothetical protein